LQYERSLVYTDLDRLDIEFFNFAPEMSPPGKTAVQVVATTSYACWKVLSPEAYRAEKARVAETIIACLERRFLMVGQ